MVKLTKLTEVFKELDIELLCSDSQHNIVIGYITIMELSEKNYNFKEQGLVMSTFQSFKNIEEINEQIDWLKDLGIHGIGFHKAHYKAVPEAVVDYCRKIHMPLFSIPVDVPYHKILDMFNQLENEQLNLKSYEIYKLNDKILESVFQEKDSGYIINLMGNYIKENLILLNPYMKVKAVWKEPAYSQDYMDQLTEALTSTYKEKLLQTRFFKRDVEFSLDGQRDTLNITPIVSKKVFIGYLIFNKSLLNNFYNDEVIRMGIRAISMLDNKQSFSSRHLRLKDIKKFESLMNNESNNFKENDFYIDVSKLQYCIRAEFSNENQLEESFNAMNTVFMERNSNVLTWIYSDTLIAYIDRKSAVEECVEMLSMYHCHSIGLSHQFKNVSLTDIGKMNAQARTAMQTAVRREERIVEWNQTGIERVAYNIDEIPLLKPLDEEILTPIIEYDQKKDSDLLATLKCSLNHFFNIKAISEALFIHPNTVRYRLAQINELLKIDTYQSTNFAVLVLAIKLYEKNNS